MTTGKKLLLDQAQVGQVRGEVGQVRTEVGALRTEVARLRLQLRLADERHQLLKRQMNDLRHLVIHRVEVRQDALQEQIDLLARRLKKVRP